MALTRTQRNQLDQGPLETYFREIDRTPLLSAEEERELAHRIQAGDLVARDQMIRANLRLVVSIARGFGGKGLSLQDLIEEGNLGLLHAVEGFDPSMNTRLSTYASFWIKESIRRALAYSGKMIRIPTYMATLMVKWRRASSKLQSKLGRAPTQEEVARFLGLSKKKLTIVKKAIRVYNSGPLTDQNPNAMSIEESFMDTQAKPPEAGMSVQDDLRQVMNLLGQLDPRDATVLRMRFGLNDAEPLTLKDIGERLGLTRERVRQIERDALKKLGNLMGDG